MKKREEAAAEMVGAILLTIILASGIAIIGLQWTAMVPTSSPPYASLEISCGNSSDSNGFFCRAGSIDCTEPLKSEAECKNDCSSLNTDHDQYKSCLDTCLQEKNCADITNPSNCNTIFICHNGGDPLEISEISIYINNEQSDNTTDIIIPITGSTNMSDDLFETGEVLRYDPDVFPNQKPLSITLTYRDYLSGEDFLMAKKVFS